tara:strand:+ start:3757 stop:4002 length:246 start_codon:yes stop_codon:yes gene_type:complete
MASETVENKILPDFRFAKHNNREYNVFSSFTGDPKDIDKWVGVHEPQRVLMDPNTYEILRNHRIEWIFDEERVLTGCKVLD